MASERPDAALKKGTAELLVLAQLEDRARHGYEIAQQIATRADGAVAFHVASLYPILYKLEGRGLIAIPGAAHRAPALGGTAERIAKVEGSVDGHVSSVRRVGARSMVDGHRTLAGHKTRHAPPM